MRTASTSQLRVGLVILASLVILAGAIFFMGNERRLFERSVRYRIHFSRTVGLRQGAPVNLSGVAVGSVEELSFPPDIRQNYIVVGVYVVGDVAPRIRADTVARIRTQGVLGDKYIELAGGSADSEPLPSGSLISSIDPIDYEALLGGSGDVIQNFTEATASLKSILRSIEKGEGLMGQFISSDKGTKWDETASNLHAASASMKNVMKSVERGEGVIGQLIQDKEGGRKMMEDLKNTLHRLSLATGSLQKITEKIERGEGTLGTLVQDPDAGREILGRLRASAAHLEGATRQLREGDGLLQRLMTDRAYADRMLGHLEATAEDLAQITGKIDRGDGTIGALVNDPELYHEVKDLMGDVKGSWLFSIYRFFKRMGGSGSGNTSGAEEAPRDD